MKDRGVRSIKTIQTVDAEIQVPSSKSYTNRALIAAALADGPSMLCNASRSDDSEYLVKALREFGVTIDWRENDLEVIGCSGKLLPPSKDIFLGNAGTAMRFLTTFA